ncbi:MAG: S-methyl-5-thioribose kinase, partial [Rhizobiaceae bacterium]
MDKPVFEALTVASLPGRLANIAALAERLGAADSWKVREVGDGNLNLVFIVEGEKGAVVVKQALPYVRLVGDSWPLPLKRSFFEYHALTRQNERDPGMVPAIHHFDEAQALIVMDYLAPHVILRRALIDGRQLPDLARHMGLFMARTLFRGSDLAMDTAKRKADLALFAGNVELCDITESLVFTDPYFDAPRNRHTSPALDSIVARLRADRDLKVAAQHMKHLFSANAQTMVHGDLHSGSIMVTDTETKVIDPEFAFYGPMALDTGMYFSNLWMSYFSQRGHEENGSRVAMRQWLFATIVEAWAVFRSEFARLWREERNGILYRRELFEDQGDWLGSEQALDHFFADLWADTLGFAGVEMHRRILGLAHNADFETIEDEALRARCETGALMLGRHLAVNRRQMHSIEEINAVAERIEK